MTLIKLKHPYIFLLLLIFFYPHSAYPSSPVAYGLCYYDLNSKKWFAYFLAVYKDNNIYDAQDIIQKQGSNLFVDEYLNNTYCVYNSDNTVSKVNKIIYNSYIRDFEIDFLTKPNKLNTYFVSLAPCSGNLMHNNCALDDQDRIIIQKELENAYKKHAHNASSNYKKCFNEQPSTSSFTYNSQGYYVDDNNKCQYYANIEINNTLPDQCNLGDEFWCHILIQYNINDKSASLNHDLSCETSYHILNVHDFDGDGENDLLLATSYNDGAVAFKIIKGTNVNGTILYKSKFLEPE